jgi:guanylate kinase
MSSFRRSGIVFAVSAPSGAGKSTICANLKQTPDFKYSVSCTTRPPRSGEENGVDYWFIDRAEFARRIREADFLEHAVVHDHHYGTPKEATRQAIEAGTDLLLDIDVSGVAQLRALDEPWIREALVDIFIMPPTVAELERRLRKRGTETAEQIAQRLDLARQEMDRWREYRYTILSGTMEEDLQKFRAIIRAERYRSSRLTLLEQ